MDGPDDALIGAILVNLGREMTGPLGGLEAAFARLADAPEADLPDNLRECARTMVAVCGQIEQTTREMLFEADGPIR